MCRPNPHQPGGSSRKRLIATDLQSCVRQERICEKAGKKLAIERSPNMGIGLRYITSVLAAGAVAATIAAAPTAAAASAGGASAGGGSAGGASAGGGSAGGGADQSSTQEYCVSSATSTKCQSPGDAEINSSIPAPYPGPFAIYGPFWAG
jgi:hypothetical protein